MKKNVILYCCAIAFILSGCSKEESPEASYKDIDWFALQDDPNDPLKHMIYEVYKATGIPIFCNDTIGSQQVGTDSLGRPYMRYETLSVNYTITENQKNILYDLEYDVENLKSGVGLMRDTLFPNIPKSMHVHSCLLTKTLITKKQPWAPVELKAFQGLNTFVIGGMGDIKKKTSAERYQLAMEALSVLMSNYLNKYNSEDLANFFLISTTAVFPGKESDNIYGNYVSHTIQEPKPWEFLGFLGCQNNNPNGFKAYNEEQDLSSFVEAYFVMGDTAFKEKYKDRKYIMEKYEILKALIQKSYQ